MSTGQEVRFTLLYPFSKISGVPVHTETYSEASVFQIHPLCRRLLKSTHLSVKNTLVWTEGKNRRSVNKPFGKCPENDRCGSMSLTNVKVMIIQFPCFIFLFIFLFF